MVELQVERHAGGRRGVRVQHAVLGKEPNAVMDVFASERQSLSRFDGFLLVFLVRRFR